MNTIDVNSVLTQIRALRAQTGAAAAPLDSASAPAANTGFAHLLQQSLDAVNGAQGKAVKLQESFELGDPKADLASVMLATSKAQVSFRALVEVRNRVVSAYQDVMNMPL